MSEWDAWIGREQHAEDLVAPGLIAHYAATFDRSPDAAPQGLHWCLCPPTVPTGSLGPDGHPPKGDFLPPVPLPRRMWAASELSFGAPLRYGDAIRRRSRITAIEEKAGASGPLAFVTVEHQTYAGEALAVEERQTIVYRDAATGPAPPRAPLPDESWDYRRTIVPSTALLFRYSALTFNSHRIHYDLPYATGAEGYAGLVVHGPLTASLLLDLIARAFGDNVLATFRFRAEAPAYAGRPLHVCARREGEALSLAALDDDGVRVLSASATFGSRPFSPSSRPVTLGNEGDGDGRE